MPTDLTPVLLEWDSDTDLLRALLAGPAPIEVTDTIEAQVGELLRADDHARFRAEDERAREIRRILGPRPETYGAWWWQPWRRTLTHVLPEPEYRKVRAARNHIKITEAERERLLGKHVCVVGMSSGAVVAHALALEGVGGVFTLMDPDVLALSNLNRLPYGVADLGVNKAVLAARRLHELDPYAEVIVRTDGWPRGATAELFGGRPPDVIVEQCDDFHSKLAVRELARELRIPVLTSTCENGILDVERFDLEPDRPLLHGGLADRRSEDYTGGPGDDVQGFLSDFLGSSVLNPRSATALRELGRSLTGWPQLASELALGAATATLAARRLLLGRPVPSGRHETDLEIRP
ncbi:hypothetical protein GCM10027589_30290 [Actinocorallia lasiicapitis]